MQRTYLFVISAPSLPDLSAESQEKLIPVKEGRVGLWSRVAGDVLDIATVLSLAKSDGADREAASRTVPMLVGITVLDLMAAQAVTARHSRAGTSPRPYRDRSGFPQGADRAHGAARERAAG